MPAAGAAAHGGPSRHNEAFEQLPARAELSLKAPGSHKSCLSVRPPGQQAAAVGEEGPCPPCCWAHHLPGLFSPGGCPAKAGCSLRASLGLGGDAGEAWPTSLLSIDTSRLGPLNTGKAPCLPPHALRKALRGRGSASRPPFLLASIFPAIEWNFQVQSPPPSPEHL